MFYVSEPEKIADVMTAVLKGIILNNIPTVSKTKMSRQWDKYKFSVYIYNICATKVYFAIRQLPIVFAVEYR